MTLIYDEKIDFEKWYYKDDPTHIFLFQKETFEYIKNKFSYKKLVIEDRLIKFYRWFKRVYLTSLEYNFLYQDN